MEKEYGVKRMAVPQQETQFIETMNDVSLEEVQRIMENRDLRSDEATKEMRVNLDGQSKNWD